MIKKVILISTAVLSFMHFIPAADALAKESISVENLGSQSTGFTLDKNTMKAINEVLEEQELTFEEMERLNNIATESITLINNDKYLFDSSKAIELGLTPEQAMNLKNGYESLNSSEVIAFENIKKDKVEFPGPDQSPTVVIVIGLAALINALLALGLSWLVTQILNLGAYTACKKWKNSSKSPRIFKNFCAMRGW